MRGYASSARMSEAVSCAEEKSPPSKTLLNNAALRALRAGVGAASPV
jgi:hypothetical protein